MLTWPLWWQNDYDMDVVFRISEEKKQIKYSRSEVRRAARRGLLVRASVSDKAPLAVLL
jgi:hypothetical protein